jgi:hypothetical protein
MTFALGTADSQVLVHHLSSMLVMSLLTAAGGACVAQTMQSPQHVPQVPMPSGMHSAWSREETHRSWLVSSGAGQ